MTYAYKEKARHITREINVQGRTFEDSVAMRTHLNEAIATALREAADDSRTKWQPIETAPKDGTGLLGYRHDCGVILIRWAAAVEFLTDAEIDENGDGEWEHEECWFCADFVSGSRLEGIEAPTHWMSLPTPPEEDER